MNIARTIQYISSCVGSGHFIARKLNNDVYFVSFVWFTGFDDETERARNGFIHTFSDVIRQHTRHLSFTGIQGHYASGGY